MPRFLPRLPSCSSSSLELLLRSASSDTVRRLAATYSKTIRAAHMSKYHDHTNPHFTTPTFNAHKPMLQANCRPATGHAPEVPPRLRSRFFLLVVVFFALPAFHCFTLATLRLLASPLVGVCTPCTQHHKHALIRLRLVTRPASFHSHLRH